MAKIRQTSDNIFDIPVGAYRSCGKYGYAILDLNALIVAANIDPALLSSIFLDQSIFLRL